MNAEDCIKKIKTDSKKPIPECDNSSSRAEFEHPGIYSIFLKEGSELYSSLSLDERRLLYIGIATDVYDRFFKQHFCKRNSSVSTLRRTIGAMLYLKAIPRQGKPEKKCYHYRFEEKEEKKLSNWMKDNLEWIYCKNDDDNLKEIPKIERDIVKELKPPLNIQHSEHEFKETVLRLRTVCREEAGKKIQ
jgi:hypothetical protein